jgi:FlgD Ig-like domain
LTRSSIVSSCLVALMMVTGSNAEAHWVKNGIPVAPAPALQLDPVAAPDGQGGAIIAWSDSRNYAATGQDLYVQRVDASGNPLWTSSGVPICTLPGDAAAPSIGSDGAGGAIIVWQDDRSGGSMTDIYAQRIDANGIALWPANGVVVCNASQRQTRPRLYTTGAFAVVTWEDMRSGNQDIYVQRLDDIGSALWTPNGVALCTASNNQHDPVITTDDAGGAIVAWYDLRNGDDDVYARAVDFFGTPQWTYNGVGVGVNAGTAQLNPRIIPDGASGAIIVWQDDRNTPGSFDIYGQRLDYGGNALWTPNGERVCFETGGQFYPDLVSDGSGGAIIAWEDSRAGKYDLYAQHLSPLGAPLWLLDGLLVAAPATGHGILAPVMVSDGAGGALITWEDDENGGWSDVYAQRIDGYGVTWWTPNGVPVSIAPNYQSGPVIVNSDGAAIVAWTDYRTGLLAPNVFVQRLEPTHGAWGHPEPAITFAYDNPGDQGGQVALDWTASERDAFPLQEITHYSLWRAVDSVPAAAGAAPVVSGVNARGEIVGLADVGPDFRGPAYRVQRTATAVYYWEFAGTQDAIAAPGYSALVPTRQDSTGTDLAKHYFQVVAHTSNAQVFYASPPDSAYSVDNIGPAAPVALAAMRTGDAMVDLDWSPSGANEPDFKEYWVYRSETAGFPADPAHFLKAAPDTSTTDDSADPDREWHYKVVAVDVHGNPSGESNEAWVQIVTAVEDGLPKFPSLVLGPNTPNPFGARTEVRFGLPATMSVALEVFDVAGHRVVRRELPPMSAGWQRFTFDGRDDAGALLPSGMYFYRVSGSGSRAAGMTTTRKMIIAR